MEISNYIILTDQQLVTLAHDGDAVAFETLFNRYRDGIYKLYLNRTGGNRDDADDLLQETSSRSSSTSANTIRPSLSASGYIPSRGTPSSTSCAKGATTCR